MEKNLADTDKASCKRFFGKYKNQILLILNLIPELTEKGGKNVRHNKKLLVKYNA